MNSFAFFRPATWNVKIKNKIVHFSLLRPYQIQRTRLESINPFAVSFFVGITAGDCSQYSRRKYRADEWHYYSNQWLWCRVCSRSMPCVGICGRHFQLFQRARAEISNQRLYGASTVDKCGNARWIDRLDGIGTGEFGANSGDTLLGGQIGRFNAGKVVDKKGESSTVGRWGNFLGSEIRGLFTHGSFKAILAFTARCAWHMTRESRYSGI